MKISITLLMFLMVVSIGLTLGQNLKEADLESGVKTDLDSLEASTFNVTRNICDELSTFNSSDDRLNEGVEKVDKLKNHSSTMNSVICEGTEFFGTLIASIVMTTTRYAYNNPNRFFARLPDLVVWTIKLYFAYWLIILLFVVGIILSVLGYTIHQKVQEKRKKGGTE